MRDDARQFDIMAWRNIFVRNYWMYTRKKACNSNIRKYNQNIRDIYQQEDSD